MQILDSKMEAKKRREIRGEMSVSFTVVNDDIYVFFDLKVTTKCYV